MAAQKVRTYALDIFKELFTRVDLIATPATATLAPRVSEEQYTDIVATADIIKYMCNLLSGSFSTFFSNLFFLFVASDWKFRWSSWNCISSCL